MDAVEALDLSAAKVNERGTGSAQYPPASRIALLIYCYATGTFSNRRIEPLTYENFAVHFLTDEPSPDYDSICKFRREHEALFSSSVQEILELAATAKILEVGDLTVSIDGTKILATAADADSVPLQDGLTIPDEIPLREDRLAKLGEAKKESKALREPKRPAAKIHFREARSERIFKSRSES